MRRRTVFLALLGLFLLWLPACEDDGEGGEGTFYPDTGSLYYTGYTDIQDIASFDMIWTNPIYDDPEFDGDDIYEHDFNVFTDGVYGACDSWSDLPRAYDDCPTAGLDEDYGIAFGFGSFDASEIWAGSTYFGEITFYREVSVGDRVEFDFNVVGSEMHDDYCFGFRSIWCIFTRRSKILISQSSPNLWTGVDDYRSW